jgi:hypothetical protein
MLTQPLAIDLFCGLEAWSARPALLGLGGLSYGEVPKDLLQPVWRLVRSR